MGLFDQISSGMKDTRFESFKCNRVVFYNDEGKKMELDKPVTVKYVVKGVAVIQVAARDHNKEMAWL